LDAVFQGKAYGSVAAKLLANDMDAGALRSNSVLRDREWKDVDEAVVQIARQRLVGVTDLVGRGLVYNVSDGLGTTVLEYEDISDMESAQMDMAGEAEGRNDRPVYSLGYLPLPIVHKDFNISIRSLHASRKRGQALDVTSAQIASRKVSEYLETLLFVGTGGITFGGGTIYGYMNFPNRCTVTLSTYGNWDDSGSDAVGCVIAMKQASIDAKHYGPWMCYIPTNFETAIDENYSTYRDETIRDRIKRIGGIIDVKVADYLTADNVLLVEMAPETARMVIGLQPTTVEWETKGGMISHFKVMSIMVPQLRADQDGNCGIVHAS